MSGGTKNHETLCTAFAVV